MFSQNISFAYSYWLWGRALEVFKYSVKKWSDKKCYKFLTPISFLNSDIFIINSLERI